MASELSIAPLSPERIGTALADEPAREWLGVIQRGREAFAGRVIWNVNSTANGGGVAEMLRSLIAYGRGAGVDARWIVIDGDPEFFQITKRLHNRLHGSRGDGEALGGHAHRVYDAVSRANAAMLANLIVPGDIVLLHDPQTAGLTEPLRDAGAHVVWRCHIGADVAGETVRSGWEFLSPYLAQAEGYVFSRPAFAWDTLDPAKVTIIPPSIDAFSPKNQPLDENTVSSILYAAGITAHDGRRRAIYTRQDGSPGRVDRIASVVEDQPLPRGASLVTQVSRWDRLKDPLGVLDAFAGHIAPRSDAHLVLVGPDVKAVTDDPEGRDVLQECIERRAAFAPAIRARVHLATVPIADGDEAGAIINALQRRSTVVVQKSLAEGFGLTVAEAMWKARPVVAGRVGGIQDQIVDGDCGVLVDPRDLEDFGRQVVRLLSDPVEAARMGAAAQARVRDQFLGSRHLSQYLELFSRLI